MHKNVTKGMTLDLVDCECQVSGTCYPAYPDTRDNPGEGAKVEDLVVTWNGIDVTDNLTEKAIEHIKEELLEDASDSNEPDYDDRDE
jgi:hypothetical protein